MNRFRPHVDVVDYSQHCNVDGMVHPTLIVIHATAGHNRPGVVDLVSLGRWFSDPSSEVSCHVATDNEGNSARFVRDGDKAWHVGAFNRLARGIEQVLPGDGSEVTRAMYRETARWVALWSRQSHIPIRKGAVEGLIVTRSGVVRHSELGVAGGGHRDPGPYDMHAMLSLARFYRGKY